MLALRFHMSAVVILIAVYVLTACASFNPGNLTGYKTEITAQNIQFKQISWFADRAEAAYWGADQIRAKFPRTRHIATPKGSDVQYFLEVFPKRKLQTITIRGSKNIHNAIQDLEFSKTSDNRLGIVVHNGFHKIAVNIYEAVRPHLDPQMPIAATGHSLGAAVSVILLMYLQKDGFTIRPSVNFGQPKITNARGADHYQDLPVRRVVDANDIIAMLPPAGLMKSTRKAYVHIGAEIILLKSGHYVYLDQHAANRLSVGEFWRNLGRVVLKDHPIKQYVGKIKQLESGATQIAYDQRERFAE